MKDQIFMYLIPHSQELVKALEKSGSECGWANGYVAVPKGHPWYGAHHTHEDILNPIWIEIGEELTFSGQRGDYWVFGYDTLRLKSNMENSGMVQCIETTRKIMEMAKDHCDKPLEGNIVYDYDYPEYYDEEE